jgi:hypothetical protein
MSGSWLGIRMLRRGMPDGDILVVDQLKVGIPSNTKIKMKWFNLLFVVKK